MWNSKKKLYRKHNNNTSNKYKQDIIYFLESLLGLQANTKLVNEEQKYEWRKETLYLNKLITRNK